MFFLSVHQKRSRGGGNLGPEDTRGSVGPEHLWGHGREIPDGDNRILGSVSGCLSPLPPPGGRTQLTKRTLPLRSCVCVRVLFTCGADCSGAGACSRLSYREGGLKTHGGPNGLRDGVRLSTEPVSSSQEPETLHGHVSLGD